MEVKEKISLKINDYAPDFTLPTHNEGELNLKWYNGRKNVVLAFYPGDWTPVCANQIPGYQKQIEKFEKYNTQLLAISVDSIPSHKAWAKSFGGLSFPLMSDYFPHGEVARKYGVLNHNGYAERVIFVVDLLGKIKYIEEVGLKYLPDNEKLFKVLANL